VTAPEPLPRDSLRPRIVSGALAFAVAIALIALGGWAVVIPIAVLGGWATHEYAAMLRNHGVRLREWQMVTGAVLLIVAGAPDVGALAPGVAIRDLVLALAVLLLLVFEVISPQPDSVQRLAYSAFGLLYIPWLLGYVVLLRNFPDPIAGRWTLLLPLLATFATDAGAFLIGRRFGRTRLAPEISPRKTVEGAVGGLAVSFIVVLAYSVLYRGTLFAGELGLINVALISLLVSSSAQLGDLAASLVKRTLQVKDSGSFLPGHGGVLDRTDSVLFTVPLTYFTLRLIGA